MRRGPSRLTIVPPQGSALRSHLATIVSQSNVAVVLDTDTVELPEDRLADSGIMLRDETRGDLTDALNNLEPDVFEMGLPADEDPSGQYPREEVLEAAGLGSDIGIDDVSCIRNQNTLPNIDGDWEFYRSITPPPPAEAFYIQLKSQDIISVPPPVPAAPIPLVKLWEPTLIDLSEDEVGLLEKADALAKAMTESPNHAFQKVAREAKTIPGEQRRFFWDQLYQSRIPQQTRSNEKPSDVVAKHAKTVEAIAYQVIRHERSEQCYYLAALVFGFQCLPAYADSKFKYALHKALREKVEALRELKFIQPLALTVLTPDSVHMLAPEYKALAEKVVQTINSGVKERKAELQVLSDLSLLSPGQREIIWHFYHLLKKPDTAIKNNNPNTDTVAIYRGRIAVIAKQLVAAMDGKWHRIDKFIDIGFQMLPQNVDRPTTLRLRSALQKAVDTRIKVAKTTSQLGVISVGEQAVLEKLVNQLVNKFTAEPFNVSNHVKEVLGTLNDLQKAAVLKVLGPKINELRATKKLQLTTQAQLAKALIAEAPDQKHIIIQQIAQRMSPLDTILFHEMMGESLLNSAFHDHERLSLPASTPQPGTPLLAQRIDDAVIHQYRKRIDHKVPRIDQPIEELDHNLLEEITPEPKTLWQSITSTVARGAQHISNWWGSVKNAVSEFSFMNFVRGHRSVVGATTVIAALNGYQGYQDITRVAEVASSPSSTIDAHLEKRQPQEGVRVQAAAFSQYMGVAEDGRRRVLNYAPVPVSTVDMQWHHHGLYAPANLHLALAEESQSMTPPGYEAITTLRGEEQVNIVSPWEYRVDQHDAMANIFNALGAYMNSRTFSFAYANYIPGEQDQSILFNQLVEYNPRAHHILHRIRHGDTITFGTNRAGNIVILSWYNTEMINMLAGEPPIEIRTNSLANLGEFSRSPTALARTTNPQRTITTSTVAMLTSAVE